MNRKIIFLLLISLWVSSCSSSKVTSHKSTSSVSPKRQLLSKFDGKTSKKADKLLSTAEKYMGAPYKYGGTTKAGMDCSGFIITVYDSQEINLPRRSEDQSKSGDFVKIEEVMPGDLLFFTTSGNQSINHVGIVHDISNQGEVYFIHASTSRGVIISSLNENYWNKAFKTARRVL